MATARLALPPHLPDHPVAPRATGGRYVGLAIVVVFHLALIAALLQYAPVRRSIASAAPIMVSVITPRTETPQPPPKQALTRKISKTPPPPSIGPRPEPPPLVSEASAVSPISLPPPAPVPVAPVAEPASAPAPPPPVIPPRLNADYLQNPAPAYPALARRMHEQGRVLVRVLVSADGTPERIELKTSSGFPRLDQSALETIRGWKFVPARQGDQKVAAWVVVPIAFTLDS